MPEERILRTITSAGDDDPEARLAWVTTPSRFRDLIGVA
jgi:hypothetical protein